MEEEPNRDAVNIFNGHLQTEQCAEVDNLDQEQPMPSWSVSKVVTACEELGINVILV